MFLVLHGFGKPTDSQANEGASCRPIESNGANIVAVANNSTIHTHGNGIQVCDAGQVVWAVGQLVRVGSGIVHEDRFRTQHAGLLRDGHKASGLHDKNLVEVL